MRKFLIGICAALALVATPAVPAQQNQTIDLSSLTQAQQDAIRAQVAAAAETTQRVEATPAAQVDKILSRVEEFSAATAQGIVRFAKELGIAANEFIATPTGKLVGAGLAMYFFGGLILNKVFAVCLLIAGGVVFRKLWILVFKGDPEYTYGEPVTALWGAWVFRTKTLVKWRERSFHEGQVVMTIIFLAGACLMSGYGAYLLTH